MPAKNLEQRRRLVVCSLMVELMRPAEGAKEISCVDALVLAAVSISSFGPHPMSAAKIAGTTGLPLTNTRRALKKLVDLGRVVKENQHYHVAPEFREATGQFYGLRRKGQAIRKAAQTLDLLRTGAPIRRPNAVPLEPESIIVAEQFENGRSE